jgi:hypothetical protein
MLERPTSPSLAELEAWLVAVTTDPAGVSAGIQQARRGDPSIACDLSEVDAVVTPGPKLAALQRLAIYSDGYSARLIECLVDDYPALHYALGSTDFEHLARAYITAHPSRSPSLNAYGALLPAFVRTRSDTWAPFAADLAELEWALVEAIHAETAPALAPDALARVRPDDWARLRLVPSPSLALLDLAHPVNSFYQAYRDEGEPNWPAAARTAIAVHRSGYSVFRLDLDVASRSLLDDLVHGVPLGAALAHLEQLLTPSDLAAAQSKLGRWFQDWIALGVFVELELA